MSILSDNLKYYRKQKGLTQKELEKIAGVAQTAITKYENGKWNPKRTTLQSIADALEIPIEVLLIRRAEDNEEGGMSIEERERLEQEHIEYMESDQAYEDFEEKNEKVYDLFELLLTCREYIPLKQYEKVISSINSILAQYRDERINEIQKTVNEFSDLYPKITPHDFSQIMAIPKKAIDKNHSNNLLTDDKE